MSTRYCGECGQASAEHSRSLAEFARELAEQHLLLEGRTFRTVAALCLRPGGLTRAYIEGRRVQYVPPLRLYLFVSLAFFLTLWVTDVAVLQFRLEGISGTTVRVTPADEPSSRPEPLNGEQDKGAEFRIASDPSHPEITPSATLDVLRPVHGGFEPPPSWKIGIAGTKQNSFLGKIGRGAVFTMAHPRALNSVLDEWLPRLMVLLPPVTAAVLALFNFRKRLFLVDHLSFALHGQSFLFVLMTGVVLLRLVVPTPPYLPALLGIAIVAYTLAAYRRVYGDGWLLTILKVGVIGCVYVGLLISGLVAILLYGFATVTS